MKSSCIKTWTFRWPKIVEIRPQIQTECSIKSFNFSTQFDQNTFKDLSKQAILSLTKGRLPSLHIYNKKIKTLQAWLCWRQVVAEFQKCFITCGKDSRGRIYIIIHFKQCFSTFLNANKCVVTLSLHSCTKM